MPWRTLHGVYTCISFWIRIIALRARVTNHHYNYYYCEHDEYKTHTHMIMLTQTNTHWTRTRDIKPFCYAACACSCAHFACSPPTQTRTLQIRGACRRGNHSRIETKRKCISPKIPTGPRRELMYKKLSSLIICANASSPLSLLHSKT